MSRFKRQYSSLSKELYEDFISKHPKLNISYTIWKKAIYIINKSYRDYILETGERVKIPYGFGDISINKKKRKLTTIDPDGVERICAPVDWVKTKKAGKKIYNFNDHTDGYYYGWIYFRRSGRMKFNMLWDFYSNRESARLLAKYIKDPKKDYKYRYREYLYYK